MGKEKLKAAYEERELNHVFVQVGKEMQCKHCKKFAASLAAMSQDMRNKANDKCGTARRLAAKKEKQFINKREQKPRAHVQTSWIDRL